MCHENFLGSPSLYQCSYVQACASTNKKEGFKLVLKHRVGVCLSNLNWELVPEEKGLIAEGSPSQTRCGYPRNYK